MKEVITTPGKTYAVTSPNGCTVTTEDGITLAEIEAGKQGYFVAVSGKVQLSDEAAVLTQVFKLAPQQRLALLGVLGGGVPAWFKALETELTALLDGSKFELAWLAGKKTLVVHTDRVSDDMLAAVKATAEAAVPEGVEIVQYNHHIEISWQDINKYAECANLPDMRAVNPDYKEDLTSDGEWVYALTSLTTCNEGEAYGIFTYSPVRKINIEVPKLTYTMAFFRSALNLETATIRLPKATSLHSLFLGNPVLTAVDVYAPIAIEAKYSFGHRHNPCLKLSHVRLYAPKLSSAYWAFESCVLDRDSVLNIVDTIPSYTSGSHPLDLGIHVDYQNDEAVAAAISEAEEKGWTVTVKWNGTPTAQAAVTYGLRKPMIFARLGELENGERVLDWGHYVTDPTLYEEFRSVEAAREYYGLPAEDLTNN